MFTRKLMLLVHTLICERPLRSKHILHFEFVFIFSNESYNLDSRIESNFIKLCLAIRITNYVCTEKKTASQFKLNEVIHEVIHEV